MFTPTWPICTERNPAYRTARCSCTVQLGVAHRRVKGYGTLAGDHLVAEVSSEEVQRQLDMYTDKDAGNRNILRGTASASIARNPYSFVMRNQSLPMSASGDPWPGTRR